MSDHIHRDHSRFRNIVKGKIKQDLKKYVTQTEMLAKKGKETISVPIPQIEIPRFKYGQRQQGGTGQGDGEVGDSLGQGEGQPGQGEAGSGEGKHELEIDLTLEELAQILGEHLELPKIEPRGSNTIRSKTEKYTGISSMGPDSLRHFKRTFKEALKRQISMGTYDPQNPVVIPEKRDRRFRASKSDIKQENSAVIIYMMDVSGSMGDEQKEIVRTEAFWIDTWIRSQYKGLETRYIIHDATAREVDEDTFFRTRESGGTLISSAYRLCEKMIEKDYAPQDWNIYPFHFSDGDNWSGEDTRLCMKILNEKLLPASNVFCYGQVESRYGSGQFYKDLIEQFGEGHDKVTLSKIENKEGILDSIKDFLGKGK